MLDTYRTSCYPLNRSSEWQPTYGQLIDLADALKAIPELKKGRKKIKTMTPQTAENGSTNASTSRVTRSVFDLKEFDNIQLGKEVELPKKPESMQEVSDMFANNTQKLLDLIYEGMKEDAKDQARKDLSGFRVIDDETDKLGDLYEGKFADENKGKIINDAVLAIAKMQGFGKDKSKEEKRALKEKAREFLRANPAMIESLQG